MFNSRVLLLPLSLGLESRLLTTPSPSSQKQYIAVLAELARADKDCVRPYSERYWSRLRELAPLMFEQSPSPTSSSPDTTRSPRHPRHTKRRSSSMQRTGIAIPEDFQDMILGASSRVIKHRISYRRHQARMDDLADWCAQLSVSEQRRVRLKEEVDAEDLE
jgi:hypothetical protein